MEKKRLILLAAVFLLLISGVSYGASYSYYLPYYIDDMNQCTGVALKNSNTSQNANISIITYDKNGSVVSAQNKILPGRGQTSFVLGRGIYREGWIKVTADQPLTGLCFIASSNLMHDITLISELSTELCVPHVAQDNTWDTSIMICNPNNSNTVVTLTLISTQGNVLYSTNYNIPAKGSGRYELAQLTQGTGSVEISSTQGVAAFALYNNLKSGGSSYAGISAVEPPEIPAGTTTITLTDLVGYYTLHSFEIQYNYGYTMTSDTVSSFSGYMNIYSNGYASQHFVVEGIPISASGYIQVISNTTLRLSSSGVSYYLTYNYDGQYLTTYADSTATGNYYSEEDVWRRVSSIPNQNKTYEYNENETCENDCIEALPFSGIGGLL